MTEITPIVEIPKEGDPNQDVIGLFHIAPNLCLQYHIKSIFKIGDLKTGMGWNNTYRAWVIDTSARKTAEGLDAERLYEIGDTFMSYHNYMSAYHLSTDYERLLSEDNTLVSGYALKSLEALAASVTLDTVLQLDIRRKLEKYLKGYECLIGYIRLS